MTHSMTNQNRQLFHSHLNAPILDREQMRGNTRTLILVLGAILLAEAVITGFRIVF